MKEVVPPFFAPLWRRLVVVGICATWAVVEFATNSPGWGVIALAFTGYGAWHYLFAYDAALRPGGRPQDERNGEG